MSSSFWHAPTTYHAYGPRAGCGVNFCTNSTTNRLIQEKQHEPTYQFPIFCQQFLLWQKICCLQEFGRGLLFHHLIVLMQLPKHRYTRYIYDTSHSAHVCVCVCAYMKLFLAIFILQRPHNANNRRQHFSFPNEIYNKSCEIQKGKHLFTKTEQLNSLIRFRFFAY